MKPPHYSIDIASFWNDPYPDLAKMRALGPVCFVPELDAVLITTRDAIFELEKIVDVFSSSQPQSLMTVLMGENMMRKDGEAHRIERMQMNPAVSPRVVAQVWRDFFEADTREVLEGLSDHTHCDLVTDFAMPVSANALRRITGLTNMSPEQIDAASQGMIDGISNYSGVEEVDVVCKKMTALVDRCIDERFETLDDSSDMSLLNVLSQAEQPLDSIRANIKLAISGGQNEPRDAIAGTAWALMNHPAAIESVSDTDEIWRKAFEEYARWISPIGMSPRRIAKNFQWNGVMFEEGQRAFFMYGSGNRDEKIFDEPDSFSINRNNNKSISFGAGPHFCAGANVSRCLIADVALPLLFERFPSMRIDGDVAFGGWAFRGPLQVRVKLQG